MSARRHFTRVYSQAEVLEIARRGKTNPASLSPDDLRALAVYVLVMDDAC